MKRRITDQKLKVLNYLKSVKTHPTAEMVFQAVRKEMPSITLATVYRNLNLMAEERQILRMEIDGEYHYDADMCYHQHCVCKECGEIEDVFQKEISEFALDNIKMKGFQPKEVDIIFKGICEGCQNENK